ncbi:ALK tyrosine kinase receptor-like [Menidia menidia]
MGARVLVLLVGSAVFLAGIRGTEPPEPGNSSSSGEPGGGSRRDSNQTLVSRNKRRTLAVDFAVPSLLRHYLAEFTRRPLNGTCRTPPAPPTGCPTVRANLRMLCAPLQKTMATFAQPRAGSAPRTAPAPPLSRVLKLGLTKASRKSNQVVVEIGGDVVAEGCGGLHVHAEAPAHALEMDLSAILEWWLGAGGGRLRVRLMPEKKAQVPGVEDRYTAAIRAADPRLFLQISSQGAGLEGGADAGLPGGDWSFSWVAEDDLRFPDDGVPKPDRRCPGNSRRCDHQQRGDPPDFSWSIVAAGERNGERGRKTGSPQGWEEGHFLWVNSSAWGGPWVLSPWLWGGPCSLDMAVFLHPRQSGHYTVWLLERDKPPLALFSTDTLPRITGWALVQLTLGANAKANANAAGEANANAAGEANAANANAGAPFRVSAGYDRPNPQDDTATIEPHFTTNCTMAPPPGPNITLRGQFQCRGGAPVPLDQLCDFRPDCPLGDDEGGLCRGFLNGSYCSFEEDECGWQSISGRSFSWRRIKPPNKGTRQSCPSSGFSFTVEGGQSKSQRGSAFLRSPLFPPPLRNSPCTVRFWLCLGAQRGSLSLLMVENGTGPDEGRSLWSSAGEPKGGGAWRLVTLPLYGLTDWFWLQFSLEDGPGAVALDNVSLSMDCFLASNGEFPPVATTRPPSGPTVKTPPPSFRSPSLSPPSDYGKQWIFHTCGAVGPEGPTPTHCQNSYRSSNVNVSVGTRGPFRGIQTWRVPETGTYRITAGGAAGGRSVLAMRRSHGVYITGDFLLRREELLHILVGQQGESACPNANAMLNKICLEQSGPMLNKSQVKGGGGGGGGATFVFKVDRGVYVPLIIAAGGGGPGLQQPIREPAGADGLQPQPTGTQREVPRRRRRRRVERQRARGPGGAAAGPGGPGGAEL